MWAWMGPTSLKTPSSALSRPSGVPVATVAGLTHDELQVNLEFMKYMSLVNVLLAREKPPLNCMFSLFLFFNSN
jgi:hypothetical protein